MDHYCRKRLEKRTTKHKKGRDSILGNHRHATKLFRGYRGTKSAGTCINAEKMRGWGNQKWETEKRGKRVEREREKEKLWAGGKERRARLAAGGSNCVINLKVRFSRERGPGARKGEGRRGKEEERERARDIRMLPVGLCRGVRVFFRGTVYTCETTARIRNCRWTATDPPVAARDERPWIRYRYCYYGGSTVGLQIGRR